MTLELAMIRSWSRILVLAGVSLSGCTSDPAAPANQAFPIRQMDRFFSSLSAPSPVPDDYTRQHGYAPAYPQYAPQTTAGRSADASTVERASRAGAGS